MMKWKRKRSKNAPFLFVLGIIIISSAILLIRSSIFTIHTVEVELEKIGCADVRQIKDGFNLIGQNFFFINFKKIENDIKGQFLCIQKVAFSKYFPNKLKLSVVGREAAAVLHELKEATNSALLDSFLEASSSANFTLQLQSGKNFLVDNEGLIFSQEEVNAPRVSISGVNFSLGQKVNEQLMKTLKILKSLKSFEIIVYEANIFEETLLINTIPKMIFQLDKEIDSQIASLQLILEKAKIDDVAIEFIDLRFDKPIVRIAPKKK